VSCFANYTTCPALLAPRQANFIRWQEARICSPPPPRDVAAGILPAVEPGILPGGMALGRVWDAGPGGKMPPYTAGRMPAATWWWRPDGPAGAPTASDPARICQWGEPLLEGVPATNYKGCVTYPGSDHDIIIWWSEEDGAFIAAVPQMRNCTSKGRTRAEALERAELAFARLARQDQAGRWPSGFTAWSAG
jgi:hypothetical protein